MVAGWFNQRRVNYAEFWSSVFLEPAANLHTFRPFLQVTLVGPCLLHQLSLLAEAKTTFATRRALSTDRLAEH
ncbi:hypothetical protein, partial [Gelidibacter salicanalis]|uniref:hypothetical protein n=1 Tax=Gelidibacter salicanalis TaxID=291193 RepID=UPI001F1E39B0